MINAHNSMLEKCFSMQTSPNKVASGDDFKFSKCITRTTLEGPMVFVVISVVVN